MSPFTTLQSPRGLAQEISFNWISSPGLFLLPLAFVFGLVTQLDHWDFSSLFVCCGQTSSFLCHPALVLSRKRASIKQLNEIIAPKGFWKLCEPFMIVRKEMKVGQFWVLVGWSINCFNWHDIQQMLVIVLDQHYLLLHVSPNASLIISWLECKWRRAPGFITSQNFIQLGFLKCPESQVLNGVTHVNYYQTWKMNSKILTFKSVFTCKSAIHHVRYLSPDSMPLTGWPVSQDDVLSTLKKSFSQENLNRHSKSWSLNFIKIPEYFN